MLSCGHKQKTPVYGKGEPIQMVSQIKVAVCGELPTACNFLLSQGVVQIDQYLSATEIAAEADYHLILVYAPHAEGLLNTAYSITPFFKSGKQSIPIRLLNEPCCHSALVELKSTIRRIRRSLQSGAAETTL